jgi:ABC-2 type transport system ATP-binding protein
VQADEAGRRLVAAVAEGAGDLRRALDALDDAGIGVLEFGLRRPTLDDVFLTLTGQALQDGPDAAAPAEEVVA